MWHVCFCVLHLCHLRCPGGILKMMQQRIREEHHAVTRRAPNDDWTRIMFGWKIYGIMMIIYGMYLWNVLHVLLLSCFFFWFAVMFAHVCCIQCHVHWDYFCRNFGRCRLFAEDIPLSLASLVLLEQTFYGCNSALWVSTLWDPRKMGCCLLCFPHSLETQFLIHT